MSRRVEELLAVARQVEVAEPPPLAAIRSEVGVRTRRAAKWMAFAVAIPLGAAGAAGGWMVRQQVTAPVPALEHRAVPPAPRPAPKVMAVEPVRQLIAVPTPAPAPSSAAAVTQPNTPHPCQAVVVEPDVVTTDGAASPAAVARTPGVARVAGAPSSRGTVSPSALARTPVAAPVAVVPSSGGTVSPSALARTPVAAVAVVPSSGGSMPLPAPSSPTALSEEAALLTEALTALRGRHDAAAALDAIARYRSRFPSGELATELTLAAVEAQRSSGHTAEALTELDSLSTDARRGELRVLRAELRAELGRCEEARRALAGALDALPDPLRRRALFTDASCAATLGARAEAVVRLNALLALDPNDARARALLEQLK